MSGAEHPFPWSEDAVCRPSAEKDADASVLAMPTRCRAEDPDGERCRLYRGHDGQHGDGLGTVWDRDYKRPIPPTVTEDPS